LEEKEAETEQKPLACDVGSVTLDNFTARSAKLLKRLYTILWLSHVWKYTAVGMERVLISEISSCMCLETKLFALWGQSQLEKLEI